ncbi:unnamed protein product [marine sediment metagenome]|uniref:Uncharacterized protein n=1 Tax=marine sediment metagenome TaxID=412755 RepID=X1RUN7_9ZZZZ
MNRKEMMMIALLAGMADKALELAKEELRAREIKHITRTD